MIKTIFLTAISVLIFFDASAKEGADGDFVVGSRIEGFDLEELSPIEIIDRDDIDNSTAETVGEIVRDSRLASYGGDATRMGVHGLEAERTLVLLNGRHLPRTGGSYYDRASNLNLVPLSAVERIEILTDGASSVYGSNGMFVAINIVTLEDVEGLHLSIRPTFGSIDGGDSISGSLTWGKDYGDLRISTNFDVNYTNEQFDKDKDYLNPDRLRSTYLSDNYSTSSTRQKAFPNCSERKDHLCAQYLGDIMRDGDVREISNYSELEWDMDNGMTVHADFLGRFRESGRHYPAVYYSLTLDSDEIPTSWDMSQLDYREGDSLIFTHRIKGFEILDAYEEYSLGSNLGLSGEFSEMIEGWKWSINNNIATYRERRIYNNSLLIDKTKEVFAKNRYNPFVGLNFSSVSDEIFYDSVHTTNYFLNVLSYDMNGSLYKGEKVGLSMAMGAEAGYHSYEETADPEAIRENLSGLRGLTSDGSRTNRSLYAELGGEYSHWLSSQATLRMDDFSDFGTMLSPKLALQLRPWDKLSLRGSVSRGFQLPELSEADGGTRLEGYYSFVDEVECAKHKNSDDEDEKKKYCNSNYYPIIADSNPELKEERSRSWNVGMVFEPIKKLMMEVDYWNHVVEDVLGEAPIEHFLKLQSEGKNPNMEDYGVYEIVRDSNGDPDIDEARFATMFNAGESTKRGVDFRTRYNFNPRNAVSLFYSFMIEDSYTLGSDVESVRGTYAHPRYRYALAWDYAFPGDKHRFRLERMTVGGYDNVYEDGEISPHSQYNAVYRYRPKKGELIFKAKNLFDLHPDYDRTQQNYFSTDLYANEASYSVQYRLLLN